jgi:hypothetical protein
MHTVSQMTHLVGLVRTGSVASADSARVHAPRGALLSREALLPHIQLESQRDLTTRRMSRRYDRERLHRQYGTNPHGAACEAPP